MAEFTIVGAGLAGTAVAWALHRRGRTVRLIDREPPTTTSRVAAGLLTPITGKKPAVSWRWHELRPFAERFYREVEATTGQSFFHARPVLRLMRSDAERAAFERSEFAGLVEVTAEGAMMPTAAQLDTATYLNACREHFTRLGVYERGEWGGAVSGPTVLCQGYVSGGLFPLPFRAAKGEILTVRVSGLDLTRTLNRGGWWLAPVGSAGVPPAFQSGRPARAPGELFRFGATYSWDALDDTPTATGRAELVSRLCELIGLPFEIVGHSAGVRPIVSGRKPVIGTHPTIPGLAVLNGLSSKGSLTAPFFANMLAAHLCNGTPIDTEVDVRTRAHP